jgi:hypothetical protein
MKTAKSMEVPVLTVDDARLSEEGVATVVDAGDEVTLLLLVCVAGAVEVS